VLTSGSVDLVEVFFLVCLLSWGSVRAGPAVTRELSPRPASALEGASESVSRSSRDHHENGVRWGLPDTRTSRNMERAGTACEPDSLHTASESGPGLWVEGLSRFGIIGSLAA
jgi:hypothetical protein